MTKLQRRTFLSFQMLTLECYSLVKWIFLEAVSHHKITITTYKPDHHFVIYFEVAGKRLLLVMSLSSHEVETNPWIWGQTVNNFRLPACVAPSLVRNAVLQLTCNINLTSPVTNNDNTFHFSPTSWECIPIAFVGRSWSSQGGPGWVGCPAVSHILWAPVFGTGPESERRSPNHRARDWRLSLWRSVGLHTKRYI